MMYKNKNLYMNKPTNYKDTCCKHLFKTGYCKYKENCDFYHEITNEFLNSPEIQNIAKKKGFELKAIKAEVKDVQKVNITSKIEFPVINNKSMEKKEEIKIDDKTEEIKKLTSRIKELMTQIKQKDEIINNQIEQIKQKDEIIDNIHHNENENKNKNKNDEYYNAYNQAIDDAKIEINNYMHKNDIVKLIENDGFSVSGLYMVGYIIGGMQTSLEAIKKE